MPPVWLLQKSVLALSGRLRAAHSYPGGGWSGSELGLSRLDPTPAIKHFSRLMSFSLKIASAEPRPDMSPFKVTILPY